MKFLTIAMLTAFLTLLGTQTLCANGSLAHCRAGDRHEHEDARSCDVDPCHRNLQPPVKSKQGLVRTSDPATAPSPAAPSSAIRFDSTSGSVLPTTEAPPRPADVHPLLN